MRSCWGWPCHRNVILEGNPLRNVIRAGRGAARDVVPRLDVAAGSAILYGENWYAENWYGGAVIERGAVVERQERT